MRHAGAVPAFAPGAGKTKIGRHLSARRAAARRPCAASRALSLHARPQRRALPSRARQLSDDGRLEISCRWDALTPYLAPVGCMPMAMRVSPSSMRSWAPAARHCRSMAPRALPRSAPGRTFGAGSSTSSSRADRRLRKRHSTKLGHCSTSSDRSLAHLSIIARACGNAWPNPGLSGLPPGSTTS